MEEPKDEPVVVIPAGTIKEGDEITLYIGRTPARSYVRTIEVCNDNGNPVIISDKTEFK